MAAATVVVRRIVSEIERRPEIGLSFGALRADRSHVSPSFTRMRALAALLVVTIGLLLPAATQAAPIAFVDSYAEGANPQYQHAVGDLMWVNPAMNGSFELRIGATDSATGIQRVDFPDLGSGWTPAGASDSTGPTPFTTTYSWTQAAAEPGTQPSVAWSNANETTTAPFQVLHDALSPTGGSLTAPDGWSNAMSIDVAFVAPSDAQSGLFSLQIQRRAAPIVANACGSFGAWSNIGAANPSSPFGDTTYSSGTCYQYRLLATDNVGNVSTISAATTVMQDRTPPFGTISSAVTGPLSGPTVIDGTADDSWAGIVDVDLTWQGPSAATGTVCLDATLDGNAWSCAWDPSALTPGVYTLVLVTTDAAANQATFTRTLQIEAASSATAALDSVTEVSGSQFQHTSGSTIWFNPAQAGSFTLAATASAQPALASVTLPALGAGWTPTTDTVDTSAPYAATYAWSAGAAAPGARAVVATSSNGATGTGAFTVAADSTPPVGPTITAQTTVTRDTSAPVAGFVGADSQSGIGTWRYQRRATTLAGDACGAWSAWVDVSGTNPAGPISDQSLPDASCLQYRFVVADNVGNTSTVTQPGELRVDRSVPTVSIDPVTAPLYGTVTLGGSALDAATHVRSVGVMVEGNYSICPSAPLVNGRWTCDWAIGIHEVGPATIAVTVTDAAGQRATITQPVTIVAPPSPLGPREEDIDRTPPVVGLARMPLISWTQRVRVKASAYDDRPGTNEIRVEQQSALVASARFTPWAPSYEESYYVPLFGRGRTYCFRGIAVDEAGNRAASDPRCTTVPLDNVDLRATGRWKRLSVRGAWRGSLHRSTTPRSSLWVKVASPRPILVVTKCRGCGVIRVMHGRRIVGTYSLNARRTLPRRLIRLPALQRPSSTPLRIITLNRRPVLIDALVVAR